MHPTLPAEQGAPAQEQGQLDALTADLQLLDQRLHLAVDRLRQQLPEDADPAHRGLIIDEDDVDGWLATLGSAGSMSLPGGTARLNSDGRVASLASLFGLNMFERAFVLTALAPEVDLAYASLYAYVQDDVTRKYATLDLAALLWCSSLPEKLRARQALGSGSPLRRHLLMAMDESPYSHLPLLARAVHLDARISAYLLGSDDPDNELSGAVKIARPGEALYPHQGALPPEQVRSLAQLAREAMLAPGAARENGRTPGNGRVHVGSNGAHEAQGTGEARETYEAHASVVVWMRGQEKQAKRVAAEQVAQSIGCPLVVVDLPSLVALGGDVKKLVLRAMREARLQGGIVYWEGADLLGMRREELGIDLAPIVTRALEQFQGCAMFDLRSALPLHVAGTLPIELYFPMPSNDLRRQLWERALGGAHLSGDVDLQLLTGAFRLGGEQIEAAADTARNAAMWRAAASGDPQDAVVTMRDLLTACRAHSNQGLGMLARKINVRYTWNDLVLPTDRLAQLHEMCYHIKYGPLVFETWGFDRKLAGGKGLNVLFAGQPGTGKTMAAEVLATDLGLELYKIDLSSVVSKYIGETEKNLEKIFSEGQTSNAILFFDEADSLFGKRSSVKDSHDRYANIEISYLLQRMEEYDGIVILATNLRKNLDDAFVRRLHGAIEFPMPEEPDRLEIWQRTFPQEAPLSPSVDLEFFAKKFKLSGGNIKNIVLESAFFAAEAGTDIMMEHVVKATRREHQKIGKLIQASDFGPYAYLVTGEVEEE